MRAVVAGVIALALGASMAHAQPADVPALVKVIESQPGDLDRSAWKEKRRDAARKLAQSKDRRAVPTLIKLADTETFDIIGEIAIEGLGNLGDPSAVPVLTKIANDTARDKAQRDLARKALGKLPAAGTTATGGGTTTAPAGGSSGTPPTGPGTTGTTKEPTGTTKEPTGTETTTGVETGAEPAGTSTTSGSALLGERSSSELPALPDLPEDTLAAYERLTFAAGTAHLGYDTVRKRAAFDADVAGLYAKRIERETMAWGLDVGANLVAGLINPEGRAQTRGAQLHLTGRGEARFYSGKLYGIGKAAVDFQMNYLSDVDDDDPNADLKDTRFTADLQVAIGGGYGRLLDVGGAIRVRRLSRTLDAARALGRPIDAAVARRLELTWWSLRGERSTYRALVTTIAILRESGILLGEPDAGLTYEILNVLRDSQLFLRPSGLDLQVVVAEGYLHRPDDSAAGQEGRVEQALVSAGYGVQLAEDKLEVSGTGYARMRLFAPDDPAQPSPWAVGAGARMRRFTYTDHGDPVGVFDLGGDLRLSDDDVEMDSQIGMRIAGELGFTWWMSQASGFRLAATAAVDGGEVFIGAKLEATYGFLDATFAGL